MACSPCGGVVLTPEANRKSLFANQLTAGSANNGNSRGAQVLRTHSCAVVAKPRSARSRHAQWRKMTQSSLSIWPKSVSKWPKIGYFRDFLILDFSTFWPGNLLWVLGSHEFFLSFFVIWDTFGHKWVEVLKMSHLVLMDDGCLWGLMEYFGWPAPPGVYGL